MRAPHSWRLLLLCLSCLPSIVWAGCGRQQPTAPTASPEKDWSDHTQGLPFVIGYEAGLQKAAGEGKPAMMFVTTTWCGWCKKLAEESFNDPQVRELLSHFVCVIVDGDVEKDAQTRLGAGQGYPHVIFLSPNGDKLGECLGYRPVNDFENIVKAALAAGEPPEADRDHAPAGPGAPNDQDAEAPGG